MPLVEQQAGLSWETLCTDPRYAFLDDLPFKVETNEWGQIVMSPTYLRHGLFQVRIAELLGAHLPEGQATVEASVQTQKGVKVADVAWFSATRWAEVRDAFATPVAPEICVEVRSASNTADEMDQKRDLYFAAGADEVWICDIDGRVHFFDREGERERSVRAPRFPERIED